MSQTPVNQSLSFLQRLMINKQLDLDINLTVLLKISHIVKI